MHFFAKIFGHVKKKQYLCTRFRSKTVLMPLPAEAKLRKSAFEALLGGSRFSRLTGDRSGCYRLVA